MISDSLKRQWGCADWAKSADGNSFAFKPTHLSGLTCLLAIFAATAGAADLVLETKLDVAATPAALIRSAFAHHPSLRAQSGMQDAAKAGVEGAKWQYWPTPSVGLERANTSDPTYTGDSTVTTLRLQQPLWTGGRLDGNLSKAEAQAVVAGADYEATRQQVALRTLQAWSEALAAHVKMAAYQRSVEVHARLLGLVERRTREGASAQADIDLAQSRLDSTEAEIATVRAQRLTALDKLRLLTGRSVITEAFESAANTLPPDLTPTLDATLTAAREQSPQMAKSRAQLKIAEADVALAKATLSPEVYLRAERQYGNFTQPGQAPQNRVFIGMSTALGGGLSSLSGIDAARARQHAAQEDIQTQQLALDEQVQSDRTLALTAADRQTSLERVRSASADVSASWERQFMAGRKQWQDLMNATREEVQNDIQLADVLATRHLTAWRLAILTQGVDAALELKTRPLVHLPASLRRARTGSTAVTHFPTR